MYYQLQAPNTAALRAAYWEAEVGGLDPQYLDKEEVLRDLCTILDHQPQQEMSWTVTLTVSGTTLVNLEDVEDFDIRYELSDNLSVDSNDFNTNVDSWDIDLVDSQEWN